MTPLLLSALALSGACNSGRFSESAIGVQDFHGLVLGASWTWRDDTLAAQYEEPEDGGELEVADEPAAEQLLKGRLEGDTIVIRRGARFPDGADEGHLQFDTGAGLALVSWDFAGMTGDTWLPLVYDDTAWEDTVQSAAWSCTYNRVDAVRTWYAVFEDTLQITCSGGEGPAATWTFARDRGLVRLDSLEGDGGAILLDLVGGW